MSASKCKDICACRIRTIIASRTNRARSTSCGLLTNPGTCSFSVHLPRCIYGRSDVLFAFKIGGMVGVPRRVRNSCYLCPFTRRGKTEGVTNSRPLSSIMLRNAFATGQLRSFST